MKKLSLIASLMLLAAGAFAAEFPEISIPELKTAMTSQKLVLLDANGTDSWQSGHIPGAVDFSAQKEKLAAILPADKNELIVAYCGNPQCAAYLQAAEAAKKLGYTNIKHLVVGIAGWKDAHEKTEKGG
jgi:rhodanese-related sulfurtransferase